jgi:hypothetical protein
MKLPTLIAAIVASVLFASCGGGGGDGGTTGGGGDGGGTTGGGGTSTPAPTVSLTAAAATIDSGGATTLTWSSNNATSCNASGGWTGTLGTSGSQSTGPLTANSTFSLTCTGAGGTSSAANVAVAVSVNNGAPTVSLSAYPTVVASGETSVITWNSTNASACSASGGWSGTVATTGTQATSALTVPTNTFTLTCTGTGGTPAAMTASVTVDGTAMSVSPTTAAITLTNKQQFTATVPGGGPATWTVDGIAGGNPTVGLIGSDGLFTSGTAPGAHAIVVASVANNTKTVSAVAAVTDLPGVYTFHNNLLRDGTNTQEYALTTSSVSAAHFGKLTSCAVDGAVYTQPLWMANLAIGGAKRNVVFVATQHDSVYAFDADAVPCTKLWSVSLIDAAHGAVGAGGETSVPNTLIGSGYGDVKPEIGVTGTPVIDPASGLLYVLSKSIDASQTNFFQRLHAIDITTGNEKGTPITIAATAAGTADGGTTVVFSAKQEFNRAALALVNGVVYVAFSSHEDTFPYFGWMMGYQFNGAAWTQTAVINVAPNTHESGIWLSGGAPAADADNKLYVITGNGIFDTLHGDYGDSLLQLVPPAANASPTFTVAQYFTPTDEATDRLMDLDFGAGGAALLMDLPAGNTVTHALVCGGKDRSLYVINRDLLGSLGDAAAVQKFDFGGAIFATAAFWNNSLYMAGVGTGMQAYKVNTSTVQLSQTSVSAHIFGFPGATPTISASSATQNGVVWSIDGNKNCQTSPNCGPAVVLAHDATNMATELWNSSLAAVDAAGFAVKFTVPTVANGRVYVGTRGNNIGTFANTNAVPINGELDIYGIKQ